LNFCAKNPRLRKESKRYLQEFYQNFNYKSMTEKEFLKYIHKRLSTISVGASALRNQGASGIIKTARNYFYEIKIDDFIATIDNGNDYKKFLNTHTEKLVSKFPKEARSWGAARKGLNLFFREIVYNKFFSDYYKLPIEFTKFNDKIKYLEVPLDKDVATGIYNDTELNIPKWKSIKKLDLDLSEKYQNAAQEISKKINIAKVNLDLKYWRK
jgi:hypothetical protein